MSLSVDSTDLDIADLVSTGVGGEFLEAHGLLIETEKDRETLRKWMLVSVFCSCSYSLLLPT